MAKKASPKKSVSRKAKAAKPARWKDPTPAVAAPPAVLAPAVKVRTTLSKPELKEFRRMLLEKRRSLVGDMAGMENEALRISRQDGSGDLSLMPDHPANIASDTFEQEFTLGLLESERTLLGEIDDALRRIDEGTYGMCAATGKEIAKARLMARPWSKYCIEYARMVEKGLVRAGDDEQSGQGDGDEADSGDDDDEHGEADSED